MLESQSDKDKYDKFLIQNYVDFDKSLKWCPSPDCDLCIDQPDQVAMDVHCDCGHAFCFKCENEAHVPLDCYYRGLFIQKIQENEGTSDSTELWKRVNTKPCPKCKTDIQKNSGCMHMTCSQC